MKKKTLDKEIARANRQIVANRLYTMRVKCNLSRKELSDRFNIAPSTVGMYERGERVPSDKIKKKYSIFFNETIDDIFFKY